MLKNLLKILIIIFQFYYLKTLYHTDIEFYIDIQIIFLVFFAVFGAYYLLGKIINKG
jgi:hypothetical protein